VQSECAILAGTVARLPLSRRLSDQQALTDALTQGRDDFVTGRTRPLRGCSFPYELNIIGKAYHSGTPAAGTQSMVLDIGSDTGVRPVATYRDCDSLAGGDDRALESR
jgi:hypothetical protein